MRSLRLLPLLLVFLASPAAARVPRAVDVQTDVVVMASKAVKGSLEVARHYLARRGIPESQLLVVETSDNERITRADFRTQLEAPLARFLAGRPKVRFLVTTYGIPVRLLEENTDNDPDRRKRRELGYQPEKRDYAAVDSELALVRQPDHPLEGVVGNRLFDVGRAIRAADKVLVVGRLDGPTVAIAKALVDRALQAEALGLVGPAVVDTRGIRRTDEGQGARDKLMASAVGVIKRAGFEVTHDTEPAVLDLSTQKAPPVLYWGWQGGGMVRVRRKGRGKNAKVERTGWGEFSFPMGAVAVHLHPASGALIRTVDRGWVGPLLGRHATATLGSVWEPVLIGYPEAPTFFGRFLEGYTFGESALMASRVLSWMTVCVGDPLYAPFAAGIHERQAANRARVTSAWAEVGEARKRAEPAREATALVALCALGTIGEPFEEAHRLRDQLERRAASEWAQLAPQIPSRPGPDDLAKLRAFCERFGPLTATEPARRRIGGLLDAADAKAQAAWNAAEQLYGQKQWGEALKRYRYLVSHWPMSRLTPQARARIAAIEKDPAARAAIDGEADEKAAQRLWNLGSSAKRNGMRGMAVRYFSELASTYPKTELARKARLELERLR